MLLCNKRGFLLSLFILLFSSFYIYSNEISMPSMPVMPSMPTLESDFYIPLLPKKLSIDNDRHFNGSNDSGNKTVLESGEKADDLLNKFLKDDKILKASDISSLYEDGLFSDFYSLNKVSNNDSMLLDNLLKSLDELKKEQNSSSPQDLQDYEDKEKDASNFKKKNDAILRFKINGYDIKESIEETFLSNVENDGSFLFTCDRSYIANGKNRQETFYILFEHENTISSSSTYNVHASISQDFKNENSFIYKLCNLKDLVANRVGNLVVLKYESKDFNVDLLIDLNL